MSYFLLSIPTEINLPLLDRMYKEIANPSKKLINLHEKIKTPEGYMPVTPEYNHSTLLLQ